jgi:hypothetical protein
MRELLLGVLSWIVPEKFVLVQPAAPVNKGNTKHFSASAARDGFVRARVNFQVTNVLAGFLNNDVREYELYFHVLLDGVGVGIGDRSRSRSRSLRWCGGLQDGYGSDRDRGCTLQSESCRQGITDTLGSLRGTQVRLAFLLLQISENSDVRGGMRQAD